MSQGGINVKFLEWYLIWFVLVQYKELSYTDITFVFYVFVIAADMYSIP